MPPSKRRSRTRSAAKRRSRPSTRRRSSRGSPGHRRHTRRYGGSQDTPNDFRGAASVFSAYGGFAFLPDLNVNLPSYGINSIKLIDNRTIEIVKDSNLPDSFATSAYVTEKKKFAIHTYPLNPRDERPNESALCTFIHYSESADGTSYRFNIEWTDDIIGGTLVMCKDDPTREEYEAMVYWKTNNGFVVRISDDDTFKKVATTHVRKL